MDTVMVKLMMQVLKKMDSGKITVYDAMNGFGASPTVPLLGIVSSNTCFCYRLGVYLVDCANPCKIDRRGVCASIVTCMCFDCQTNDRWPRFDTTPLGFRVQGTSYVNVANK